MHKRANRIRDELGSNQWKGNAENTVEEKVYRKMHPQAD